MNHPAPRTLTMGDENSEGHGIAALQRAIGVAAVAVTAPYLTLKIAWLAGSTIGMADPTAFASSLYVVGNLATVGMDAMAILLALALTRPWGRRLPAGLVLLPAWLATGFLAPIVVVMLGAPAVVADPAQASDALGSWVYLLVYGGFGAQGLLLMAAFASYVYERWGTLLRSRRGAAWSTPSSAARTPLLIIAVALAAATGAFELAWALGAQVGLSGTVAAQPPVAYRLTSAVYAAFAFAAVAGLPLMARWTRRGGRLWVPLALTWVGTGSLFACGCWQWVTIVADPATGTALVACVTGMRVLAGVLIGVTIASVLRSAATRPDAASRNRAGTSSPQ